MSDLLLTHGRLFDPASGLDAVGDVLLREGKIAAMGAVTPEGHEQMIDAEGLWVLPGLMDMHVHLREPGQVKKENIASGTRAAAVGGFTTVVAEPNTAPPCDTAERVTQVYEIAAQQAAVRVLQKAAITVGQAGNDVTDVAALRATGAVALSDDGYSVTNDAVMRAAFCAAKAAGMPLTVHVDDVALVARDIGLSTELDWPVHFSHVSLAAEADLIAQARQRGLRVTGEATPHHLVLSADDAPANDTNYKMNPPLRTKRDRGAIRKAVAEGVLTVIASDHAPHTREEKAESYEHAPSGVVGLETTLGVVWTELVHKGVFDATTAVRAMTAGPTEVLGLEPPSLRVGARADLTVLDPQQRWVVDVDQFRSGGRNCPFAGWSLRGKAVATIVEGRLVMWEGMMQM